VFSSDVKPKNNIICLLELLKEVIGAIIGEMLRMGPTTY
jgi:hypothetical protein